MSIVDINGKPRWHPIWDGNPIIKRPTEPGQALTLVSAPHARPYIVYPFSEWSGWTFNKQFKASEHIARLYLTYKERIIGERIRDKIGPYVLIEPYTKHVNLRWPMKAWQLLVNSRPDLTFVQHTHDKSEILRGVTPIRATFREACGLILTSRLYVRSESGLIHAAAALKKPTVTIWGGCMDYEVMAGYPKQRLVLNYTKGSPCGKWLPCKHCGAAMAGISVARVSETITAALLEEYGMEGVSSATATR